ncbi:MAG TPA: nitronate monooxygenase [Gemmatimonadaceae bacterium]|nr:nitronate monooxygenase [Gemmatimonadaceae bacterium]
MSRIAFTPDPRSTTRVSERLGLRYPIIQGPFGHGFSSAKLIAAVNQAGGLGSFGLAGIAPERIFEIGTEIRSLTSGPFALNLWLPVGGHPLPPDRGAFERAVRRLTPLYHEVGADPPRWDDLAAHPEPSFEAQVEALLAVRPPIVSFVFGVPPAGLLRELRRLGIATLAAATNVVEGRALEAAGIDVIVASGSDAGGHRYAFLRPETHSLTTSALVRQLAGQVSAPIIAAGGIVDSRSVASAMLLGAEGVQVGTGFLATHESGASDAYKAALVAPVERSTVLTTAFTGRAARALANRIVREIDAHPENILPYPWQYVATRPIRVAAALAGNVEFMSLWAGQNVPLVERQSAAELMTRLIGHTVLRSEDA